MHVSEFVDAVAFLLCVLRNVGLLQMCLIIYVTTNVAVTNTIVIIPGQWHGAVDSKSGIAG